PVADVALDLRKIRHPAAHVLERAAVHLLVRNELNRRPAVAHLADALGQLENGDLFIAADVEDVAFSLLRLGQHQDTADDVLDRREAARLLAIAEHQNRLVAQRTGDHVGNHHAVGAGLARTAGVEAAYRDDRELTLLVVRLRKALIDSLAARVGPAELV